MASEVTSDLGIELSDLNYLCSHVSLASNCLRGHGGLQMTLEVTSDLKIQLSDLDYLCSLVSLASKFSYSLNGAGRRRPNMTH